MKKLFYFGILGLILFEIANVYFIMPIPGSQEMNSIRVAYFLYSWRWLFRILFAVMIVAGFRKAFASVKWLPVLCVVLVGAIAYYINYKMAADTMFYQPLSLQLSPASGSSVDADRLVIGVNYEGEAKAYPIQFLGYHHQVRDTLGGKPIMVTYCTVCRTGRVFEPVVDGKTEEFRLVGMDHFNAMFEDKTTGSWWRQATGEAIVGKLKGHELPAFPSTQTTLHKWIQLYPQSLVMQPDKKFQEAYDSMRTYERGKLTGKLTRRDTGSWQAKSWVVGVTADATEKAYDWNQLQKERVIYDQLNGMPVAIILSKDSSSFVALQRADKEQIFTLQNDTLISGDNRYNFIGTSLDKQQPDLKKLPAYQEYWHSWQTFHPATKQ